MKKLFLFIALVIGTTHIAFSQSNAVVINGAFINLNNGNSSNPVYFVVNQGSTNGIIRTGGHIISEGQYNYVSWNAGTTTGNFVIPFGFSNTTYLPLTFNKTTAVSSQLNFSTWGTPSDNTPYAGVSDNGAVPAVSNMNSVWGGSPDISVIDRWWDIYTTAATTADVTFSYRGAENTMTTGTTGPIDAQHWDGSEWNAPLSGSGTGVTSGVGTTTITGASTFSPWILVAKSAPLPVHIKDLEANCVEKGTMISWKTESELNSAKFIIERSVDGETYKTIATLNAAGNSNSTLTYNYIDENGPVDAYYRLREQDFDGKEMVSNLLKTSCPLADEKVKIFASDFQQLTIETNFSSDQSLEIGMYDVAGRLLMSKKNEFLSGPTVSKISVDVPMGLYLVTIKGNSINRSAKVILN